MQGLTAKEIEELHDDIKLHLGLDRETPTHVEYWEVLICSMSENCLQVSLAVSTLLLLWYH